MNMNGYGGFIAIMLIYGVLILAAVTLNDWDTIFRETRAALK